jgi:hypothetical protein
MGMPHHAWFGMMFFSVLWNWGMNSWLHVCKAGALPLEPQLQPIFGDESHELFAQAGLNQDSLDLSLLSSQDYRHEPLVHDWNDLFKRQV